MIDSQTEAIIVDMLDGITGEEMETLINALVMRDQMLRQLVLGAENDELVLLLEEKRELNYINFIYDPNNQGSFFMYR